MSRRYERHLQWREAERGCAPATLRLRSIRHPKDQASTLFVGGVRHFLLPQKQVSSGFAHFVFLKETFKNLLKDFKKNAHRFQKLHSGPGNDRAKVVAFTP
jgi:hypothetical protein